MDTFHTQGSPECLGVTVMLNSNLSVPSLRDVCKLVETSQMSMSCEVLATAVVHREVDES